MQAHNMTVEEQIQYSNYSNETVEALYNENEKLREQVEALEETANDYKNQLKSTADVLDEAIALAVGFKELCEDVEKDKDTLNDYDVRGMFKELIDMLVPEHKIIVAETSYVFDLLDRVQVIETKNTGYIKERYNGKNGNLYKVILDKGGFQLRYEHELTGI